MGDFGPRILNVRVVVICVESEFKVQNTQFLRLPPPKKKESEPHRIDLSMCY